LGIEASKKKKKKNKFLEKGILISEIEYSEKGEKKPALRRPAPGEKNRHLAPAGKKRDPSSGAVNPFHSVFKNERKKKKGVQIKSSKRERKKGFEGPTVARGENSWFLFEWLEKGQWEGGKKRKTDEGI